MKQFVNREGGRLSAGVLLVIVLFIASGVWMVVLSAQVAADHKEITMLRNDLSTTTAALQFSINQSNSVLADSLNALKQNTGTIQQQIGGVESQVGNLSGSLTILQKLALTDPELLKKYSKIYFLNENYTPARLSQIPQQYEYTTTKQMLIHTDVLPHLQTMLNNASSSGVTLFVASAYRSFAEQKALKGDYKVTYGAGTANSFSADQGYSEHQLGTAVDFITTGTGGALEGFDKTPAYQWMVQNAYRYGFVISYSKNNSYYIYEPWHWRYVGVKLATDLHNQGKDFYDLDQRIIDTYLVSIFEN
jgi:D-alanyl-D-alanine carboxypeptidase